MSVDDDNIMYWRSPAKNSWRIIWNQGFTKNGSILLTYIHLNGSLNSHLPVPVLVVLTCEHIFYVCDPQMFNYHFFSACLVNDLWRTRWSFFSCTPPPWPSLIHLYNPHVGQSSKGRERGPKDTIFSSQFVWYWKWAALDHHLLFWSDKWKVPLKNITFDFSRRVQQHTKSSG